MEKEQYKLLISGYESDIIRAKEKIKSVKETYIATNKQFEIGDKIKITTPRRRALGLSKPNDVYYTPERERFAFVKGYEVGWNGELVYKLSACKKDGTESKHSDNYTASDILTLEDFNRE